MVRPGEGRRVGDGIMWQTGVRSALGTSRRLRGMAWLVSAILLGSALTTLGSSWDGRPAPGRPAEATADWGPAESVWLLATMDPVYDQFLREFEPLADDSAARRYLTAQVLAAAAAHRLDPDLLFALIAVESGFDSRAVSKKGARGLGQMKYRTAQEAAPRAVRRPGDLYDVPRNLYATAQHLRGLLDQHGGDLRKALKVYHGGPAALRRRHDPYVARVSAQYAYLKVRRMHGQLAAVASGPPDAVRK